MSALNLTDDHLLQLFTFSDRLTNLEELDLSYNAITHFPAGRVTSIRRLGCSHNNLNASVLHTLKLFPNLKELDVRENPELKSEANCLFAMIPLLPQLETLNGKSVKELKEKCKQAFAKKTKDYWKDYYRYVSLRGRKPALSGFLDFIKEKELKDSVSGLSGACLSEMSRIATGLYDEKVNSTPSKILRSTTNSSLLGNKRELQNSLASPKTDSLLPEIRLNRTPMKKMPSLEPPSKRCKVSFASSNYEAVHLLRTHSADNDPHDELSAVNSARFCPHSSHDTWCATAGGDSVCIIDCSLGRVMKKFREPGETFTAVAWVASEDWEADENLLLVAGGQEGNLYLISLATNKCFDVVCPYDGATINSLVSISSHPHLLLSKALGLSHDIAHALQSAGAHGRYVCLNEISSPTGRQRKVTWKKLLELCAPSDVWQVSYSHSSSLAVAVVDDGCHLWNLASVLDLYKEGKPIEAVTPRHCKFRPHPSTVSIDSVSFVGAFNVASKGVPTDGGIVVTSVNGPDQTKVGELKWPPTEEKLLRMAYYEERRLLTVGDSNGCVHMFNVGGGLFRHERTDAVNPVQVLQGPPHTVLDTSVSHAARYVVAVYKNNTVCIWKEKSD